MPDTAMARDELTGLFKDAVDETIEEADYATREDVVDYLDQRLAKAEVEEEPEEEEAESVRGEKDDLLDQLREEGVPDDLVDAVSEYIAAEGVAKALGVEQVDPELAEQLEENQAVLNEQIERTEKRQQARAEAVAQGEPNADIVDSVVYGEDE
jgi:ABC-type Zn uptake system ZnuABC Zn-binding protein ZnuA